MKNTMKLILLTLPFMMLAGCNGNTWKKEKSSESILEEEVWNEVTLGEWDAACDEAEANNPHYAKAIANGKTQDDGDTFYFENVVYTRAGSKYRTSFEGEGEYQLTALVNMQVYEIDVTALGDGGSELIGNVFLSSWGNMKFSWGDLYFTELAFDKYGYMTSLKAGSVEDPTSVMNLSIEWFLEA